MIPIWKFLRISFAVAVVAFGLFLSATQAYVEDEPITATGRGVSDKDCEEAYQKACADASQGGRGAALYCSLECDDACKERPSTPDCYRSQVISNLRNPQRIRCDEEETRDAEGRGTGEYRYFAECMRRVNCQFECYNKPYLPSPVVTSGLVDSRLYKFLQSIFSIFSGPSKEIPTFEKFPLGGQGSVRGYEGRDLGPYRLSVNSTQEIAYFEIFNLQTQQWEAVLRDIARNTTARAIVQLLADQGTLSWRALDPTGNEISFGVAQAEGVINRTAGEIAAIYSTIFSGICPVQDMAVREDEISECKLRKIIGFFIVALKLNYHDGWQPELHRFYVQRGQLYADVTGQDRSTNIPIPSDQDPFQNAECRDGVSEAARNVSGAIEYKKYSNNYSEEERGALFEALMSLANAFERCPMMDDEGNETNLEAWIESRTDDEKLTQAFNGFTTEMRWNGFNDLESLRDEVRSRLQQVQSSE